jgi:hypothetical protein
MASTKKLSAEPDIITSLNDEPRTGLTEYNDTNRLGASGVDVRDMTRMGKTQEFKVNIQIFFSL